MTVGAVREWGSRLVNPDCRSCFIIQNRAELPSTYNLPSDSVIVEVLFARSNRQFVGTARLEGVRLVGGGDSPLRLLVILVDAAGSETGESTAGVIHQAGQGVASHE